MRRLLLIAAVLCAGLCHAPGSRAEDKVVAGVVGGYNAFVWPVTIAFAKGFYAEQGLSIDIIFISSSPAMLQQLAASSLDVAASAGLVDPVRLVARGAPVAIGRIELRVSPYVLVGKSQIASIKDLKGKAVAIGSRSDITHVLIEKMLTPNGLAFDDVEMMYSGSTVSRYAALKTGAFDAVFLAPPYNFIAESEGFKQLGIAGDYAKDLPFTGSIVNTKWALAHLDVARKYFAVNDKAAEWLHDKANRAEAIRILVEAAQSNAKDVGLSYDFLSAGDYFDRSHKVSRRGVKNLVDTLHELGDTDVSPTAEQVVVPGLTELTD